MPVPDDLWDGLKFYIGFGDEDFVVGLVVGGEEMVWEAALDGIAIRPSNARNVRNRGSRVRHSKCSSCC